MAYWTQGFTEGRGRFRFTPDDLPRQQKEAGKGVCSVMFGHSHILRTCLVVLCAFIGIALPGCRRTAGRSPAPGARPMQVQAAPRLRWELQFVDAKTGWIVGEGERSLRRRREGVRGRERSMEQELRSIRSVLSKERLSGPWDRAPYGRGIWRERRREKR